ncbi:hypothetical protein DE146DRAFT_773866 [Phaeosphaeria sp. MPI-PUGE-AT-0046c]|nr:hypothetical protein DE146DRAFT_773866 [Phaeosphaeria sp. MPI-PUGE-AT-0046c]
MAQRLSEKHERLSILSGPSSPSLLEWTFNDVLEQRCAAHAEHIALVSPQQGISYTFAELQHRARRLAYGLHNLGVGRGDRVGVLLGNRAEYVEIFFACAKLGAYATLINYAYSHHEFLGALRTTNPKVLFATQKTSKFEYRSMLEKAFTVQSLEKIVLLQQIGLPMELRDANLPNGYVSYETLAQMGNALNISTEGLERDVRPEDILNLQFTSGSTGLPKSAALTHRSMVNSARYIGLQMDIDETDSISIPVPLFHAFGLIIGVCTAYLYGSAIVLPSEYWDVDATLRSVEEHKCTGLYGVTTMFVDELSHPRFAATNRSSLKFGIIAGSAMPEELLHRVMTGFPIPRLYTNWGMTELSSIATMTTSTDSVTKKMRTAGRLLPNLSGKIVEPNTGRVLPWGEKGEIVISGWAVMRGYYENEEQTRNTIRKHVEDMRVGQLGVDPVGQHREWMHTGDEGFLDEDGYFVITGRIKDLIIRGGENISPVEIESVLWEHPAVKQAVVFGVASDRYGEEVATVLEVSETHQGQKPSLRDLREWVGQLLSRYKVPVHIWWLGDEEAGLPKEWPKTANGKLRKMDVKMIGEGILKRARTTSITRARL